MITEQSNARELRVVGSGFFNGHVARPNRVMGVDYGPFHTGDGRCFRYPAHVFAKFMRKTLRTLKWIALSPIFLSLGIVVALALFVIAIPVSLASNLQYGRWLRRMRSSGRVRTTTEIIEQNSSGTLIVDRPGWADNPRTCWWTPDDVESLSPIPISPLHVRIAALEFQIRADGTDLPLDCWVYDQYLSEKSGTAYLVATRNGDKVAQALAKQLMGMKILETWTAPCAEFPKKDSENDGGNAD